MKTRAERREERRSKVQQAPKNSMLQISNDLKLDVFQPTPKQSHIVSSIDKYELVIVDGASGTGKSHTAVWKGLTDLQAGKFRRIVFVKNVAEAGDDAIGYLKGSETDKLQAHYEVTRNIFYHYMTVGKLETDEKNGKIEFKIPNFLLGATLDNAYIIIDEAQLMTPQTLKLVLERTGVNSTVVILGDSRQRYAVKKRSDGFSDLISKTIDFIDGQAFPKQEARGMVTYIKLTNEDNMRSELSKLITDLYMD